MIADAGATYVARSTLALIEGSARPQDRIEVVRLPAGDSEVEVLGEPIRIEEALLQTGPALEDPIRRCGMLGNAAQDPTQGVVLLDGRGLQIVFCCQLLF